MSDRELIISFLEKAAKRARSNRRFNEIAATLAIAFLAPVGFKLLDFFFLFRGRVVSAFFIVWLIATVTWIGLRLRGSSPLTQVAANIDNQARLNDQLKTAYWFIRNPRQSEWVDAQIQKTARQAGNLRIDTIYPRRVPRASYMVAGLALMLVALNFVPLSLNYNWLYLQAAPPFRLTDDEYRNLANARKLLEKAKAAENAELIQKIEDIITELQQGNITLQDAIKQLEALRQQLEEGELDAANMSNGLEQMAAILRQSKALQDAAQFMGKGQLDKAAEKVRELEERLQALLPADLKDMSERLQQASEKPRAGLQDLARAFETTSAAIERGDRPATQSGLDRIARELDTLMQELQDQELRDAAGDELGELTESLEERLEGEFDSGEAGKAGNSKGTPGETKSQGAAEPGEKAEQQGEGEQGGEPGEEGGGEAGEPGENAEAGNNPGTASDDASGKGGNSFGGSTKSAPLEGDATSLEVQLQREALKVEPGEGLEHAKESESAGERERSKLDYRKLPSDLTPAQKDLLNQDRVPWEGRQLIKNYFQAVKPAQTK